MLFKLMLQSILSESSMCFVLFIFVYNIWADINKVGGNESTRAEGNRVNYCNKETC